MDLEDLIGPLPAPLGRWMLRRLVAAGVRYGREFSVLLIRGADSGDIGAVLRGADIFARWDGGDDLLGVQNNALSLLEYFLCNRHRSLLGVNPSSDIENEDDLSLIREVESYISEY